MDIVKARKIVLGAVVGLLTSFLGVCMLAWCEARSTEANARALLDDLRRMKVGETTAQEVGSLASKRQRRFLEDGDPFCEAAFCSYTFAFDTPILGKFVAWRFHLWRLHISPAPAYFVASVDTHDDRLVRIEMGLSSGVGPDFCSVSVDDEIPEISPVAQSFISSTRGSHISVYLKPTANARERAFAYSLNLNCITKLSGCKQEGHRSFAE